MSVPKHFLMSISFSIYHHLIVLGRSKRKVFHDKLIPKVHTLDIFQTKDIIKLLGIPNILSAMLITHRLKAVASFSARYTNLQIVPSIA